jgi:hypothetical protein
LDDVPSIATIHIPLRLAQQTTHKWLLGSRATAIGGWGLLGKPAVGAALGFAFSHKFGFGLELNGVRLIATSAITSPGQVDLSLWGSLFGPCYRQNLSLGMFLETCLIMGAGSQRATAKNYVRNDAVNRLWWILGPKVNVAIPLNRWLNFFAGVGTFGHLKRQAFSIETIGIVAEEPRMAFAIETGFRVDGFTF